MSYYGSRITAPFESIYLIGMALTGLGVYVVAFMLRGP